MFKWFKRKPKMLHHDLKDVSGLPQFSQFYRPVECKRCGKQFIMDVFGGWAIEYTFTQREQFQPVAKEELANAIALMHETHISEWIQLGVKDICKGDYLK